MGMSPQTFQTIQPSTGEPLAQYRYHSRAQVETALEELSAGLSAGKPAGPRKSLEALAESLSKEKKRLAELAAREMGKPLHQGEAEVEKCALACRYFAAEGGRFLEPEILPGGRVLWEPLGVVLGILPWNFPYWQILRFAVPTLVAGNSVAVKPALGTAGCALELENLAHSCGLGPGRFKVLLLTDADIEALVAHRRVAAVSLTGSPRAGQAVASAAGRVLKKCVLELGGSDPYLVLPGADLKRAARICVEARLVNSGQSCVAAKRFIVDQALLPSFTELVVEQMRSKRIGDPLEPGMDLGPLARGDLRDALHRQVEASLSRGARRLLGGVRPQGPGFYYPPTVLEKVGPGMPVFDEETFGPVAALCPARDVDDAVRLANQSPYGLGAALFTQDKALARALLPRLQAGLVFVNRPVASDPRLPFGGVKQSGFGRELSALGLREFVNAKTVVDD